LNEYQIIEIFQNNPSYPFLLEDLLGTHFPAQVTYIGNIEILKQSLLGLFASVKCPASLILKAHDLAQKLVEDCTPVISGFHSPVEKEMLSVLQRGSGSIVICPARGLEEMRIPARYHHLFEKGRLLLLSAFPSSIKRPKENFTQERNRIVGTLAERIMIIYANPGGKIEALCRDFLKWNKPVFALPGNQNAHLFNQGIQEFRWAFEISDV